jgi:hypothetical protein
MRIYWLLFAAGLLTAGNLHAALILQYDVSGVGTSPLGDPIYRFTYTLSGGTLDANQEVEIRFDPALYGELFNESASADFDVLIFQPNNPPGSAGIYSALALVSNPALLPPFIVEATYLGPNTPPVQDFVINFYDELGNVHVVEEGTTVALVPEPATLATVGLILGLLGCSQTVRRRLFRRAA